MPALQRRRDGRRRRHRRRQAGRKRSGYLQVQVREVTPNPGDWLQEFSDLEPLLH